MRILMSGGTGFVGRYLSEALCRRGDLVTVLTRDEGGGRRKLGDNVRLVSWEPERGGEWFKAVESQDGLVHLAGEMAVGQRWSEDKKRRIFDSRVKSTEKLVEAIASVDPSRRPGVFVCASGVGYYGDRGDALLDESSPAGDDFLSQVTQAWEAAAEKATDIGVRVVRARFGIVFGRGGGALPQMAMPFKMFVGGPIGSGKQYISWVHIDDLVGMILTCLDDDTVKGAVNMTSPNPVSNAVLSKAIGEVLHRPSVMRVPEVALKLRFGEGAEPLLTGQRATPSVMKSKRYQFRYPELMAALREAL